MYAETQEQVIGQDYRNGIIRVSFSGEIRTAMTSEIRSTLASKLTDIASLLAGLAPVKAQVSETPPEVKP